MPDLAQSLHNHDLGHLRIIAEHWGVELTAGDSRTARKALTSAILSPDLVAEIVLSLSDDGQAALITLLQNEGRLSWAQFARKFGDLRAFGPGRRDRERPDRDPISAAEELYYRGLVSRAFFDTPSGAMEFAYIADDLCPLIPPLSSPEQQPEISNSKPPLGRAATSEERAYPLPANDRLLDHICSLLAALRLQIDPTSQFSSPTSYQSPDQSHPLISFATTSLNTANLLDPSGFPHLESARAHLEATRGEALAKLTQDWLQSSEHNDLHHVPYLQSEGEWQNDPLMTRRFLVGLLAAIPKNTWWSLSAFVADLQRDYPDFQRPASDYDSWFIRDTRSGNFLRGFEHWDDVDGALIRYLITGPLHWMGILDLAVADEDSETEGATAFRKSKWAAYLLGAPANNDSSAISPKFPVEDEPIHIRSDGRINIPFLTPRATRYQIARFCKWYEPTSHEYRYRLTPASLTRAIDQGLKIQHLQILLARHAQNVPPNIVTALDRWDHRGTEARLQNVTILRLGSPELLKTLRNSRASRYLSEPLGPTTILVKPGAGEKVLEVLTELGYLGEILDPE